MVVAEPALEAGVSAPVSARRELWCTYHAVSRIARAINHLSFFSPVQVSKRAREMSRLGNAATVLGLRCSCVFLTQLCIKADERGMSHTGSERGVVESQENACQRVIVGTPSSRKQN